MQFVSGCRNKRAVLLVALGLAMPMAHAQTADKFPSRSVRLITPANPGGTTDFLARMLAVHLASTWGQSAIVDNRGSASGVNGAEITKNASPDGHTLFMVYHQHTVNAALIAKLPYHPVNDFTPITQMTEGGLLLVVNPSHPAKNAKEFLQWVKTTKDPINIGSAGIGSGGHLAGELLKIMAGFQAQHIPYKGTGPAIVGLLGGEYHFNFMGVIGPDELCNSFIAERGHDGFNHGPREPFECFYVEARVLDKEGLGELRHGLPDFFLRDFRHIKALHLL